MDINLIYQPLRSTNFKPSNKAKVKMSSFTTSDSIAFSGKKGKHPVRNGMLGLGALLSLFTIPLAGCQQNDTKGPPPTVAEQTTKQLNKVDTSFQETSKMPLNVKKLAAFVGKLAGTNSALAQKHDMKLIGAVVMDFTSSTSPGDYNRNVVSFHCEKSGGNSEEMISVPARIIEVSNDENGQPVLKVINYIYGKDNLDSNRDISSVNESLKDLDPSNPDCDQTTPFIYGVGTGIFSDSF